MKHKAAPMCREHGSLKQWLPTTFEYTEDDVTVRIPGVYHGFAR